MADNAISQLSGLFGTAKQNTAGDAMPAEGSNQYGSYPNIPGVVPPATSGAGSAPLSGLQYYTQGPPGPAYQAGNANEIAQGYYTTPTYDPMFTGQFYNYLTQQLGQGTTPFNLSSQLPTSGQATQPGQLTAPMNDLMQQLMQFYSGGQSNIPGASQMTQMAQTGNPIDQTPAWQAMIEAQGRNTEQNAANLREQFAFGGNLKSSPFGNAMTDYYSQTAKDQNALLGQMTAQAGESAQGRELQAQNNIFSGAQGFGSELQGLDQNSINAMYQEFIRTQPEYNPMMQMMAGGATASPSIYRGNSVFQNIMQGAGMLLG